MENNNILLISNNNEISQKLQTKLVLLRAADKCKYSCYENFKNALKENDYKIIVIHEHKNKELTKDIIKFIKSESFTAQILLLLDEINYEFILSAYDIGINNYFSINDAPAEILVKVINAIKVYDSSENFKRNFILLKQLDYVSDNDFYTEKAGQEIIENELDKLSIKDGHFVILTYDEADKNNFDRIKMANAIKNSLRLNDIVVELKSGKYYILLGDTGFSDVEIVINKIKNKTKGFFNVKAGITSVKERSFAELEKKASSALTDAMLNDIDYASFDENQSDDDIWLEIPEKPKKDYKIFRQTFNKKLEKVIAPVFFRLQKAYEDKIENTKIEQYTDDIQSVFGLRSKLFKSKLKIVYPGLGKVVVIVSHEGLDSPENREMTLTMNQITQKGITNLIEDFIQEYIDYTQN